VIRKTPLRRAVERWIHAHQRWREPDMIESVRTSARVTEQGARIYIHHLATVGVLTMIFERNTVMMGRGPEVAFWLSHQPRTKPGGNSRAYLRRVESYRCKPAERRDIQTA
jgi:hypothetical protein